jgi:hypothetical protein
MPEKSHNLWTRASFPTGEESASECSNRKKMSMMHTTVVSAPKSVTVCELEKVPENRIRRNVR